MLNRDTMPAAYLMAVKRHLNITWTDPDTDEKIMDKMMDAEAELNHILGAELDYFIPGMARSLYMDYMMYVYNECRNDFENAYRKEIIRVRIFYKIKRGKE